MRLRTRRRCSESESGSVPASADGSTTLNDRSFRVWIGLCRPSAGDGEQNGGMDAKEWRTRLRGAVYRGDGRLLVTLLGEKHWQDETLQLIGDGLIAALAGRVEGAAGLGGACVEALRGRNWDGDGELADCLDALLGTGPVPMLRPLPVDLEELAGVLEGDPVQGGRIDLQTCEVWPRVAFEYAQEMDEDDEDGGDAERWLWVQSEGSHAGYRDMELFIAGVSDPGQADRLRIAIEGRGAFGRFKQVLGRWPDELERWYTFSDDRQRGRARAWLAGTGYLATLPAKRPQPGP